MTKWFVFKGKKIDFALTFEPFELKEFAAPFYIQNCILNKCYFIVYDAKLSFGDVIRD